MLVAEMIIPFARMFQLVALCPVCVIESVMANIFPLQWSVRRQYFTISVCIMQVQLFIAQEDSSTNLSFSRSSLDVVTSHSLSYVQMYFAVPAEWSTWSSWSDCSVTCGLGERVRIRICGEDTEEFAGENNCQGNPEQIQICRMSECPVSK
jgi:hypothetical protein